MTTRDEIEKAVNEFADAVRASMAAHYLISDDAKHDHARATAKQNAADARARLLALLSPAPPDGDVTRLKALEAVAQSARRYIDSRENFDTLGYMSDCEDAVQKALKALDAAASDDGQERDTK